MDKPYAEPLDAATRLTLVILAVAQGLALYLLHLALDHNAWPATDLPWLKALYAVAIGLPAFLYLGMERLGDRRNIPAAAGVAALLFLLGWHLGWVESAEGAPTSTRHEFTPAFALSIGVALFILAFFHRTWSLAGRLQFDYPRLLSLSWQQSLTLGLLGLFVGVFWLLLFLWAALFEAIGVDFFEDLFTDKIFIYPVTWLVIGLGLVLIRNRIRLVATVQFMCEALIKALLPLAALIVLLFLGTLPFTGLEPIWDTGHAALLMMLLGAVLLFFFNAVLGEAPERPTYPAPLRWLVYAAVALSPVSTLLAGWALWLRVDQYGLTVDRLWAGVIVLLLALYTGPYAALVLWRRDGAVGPIQALNTGLALAMAAVLVVVNTPLADLRAWAAASQTDRLLAGEVDPKRFDYDYLRFSLGAYGARALERIADSELARNDDTVRQRVAAVLEKDNRWSPPPAVDTKDAAAVAEVLPTVPPGETLPGALVRQVKESQPHCLRHDHRKCQAVRMDDTPDGPDWIVASGLENRYTNGTAYVQVDGQWLIMGNFHSVGCDGSDVEDTGLKALERLEGPFLAYGDGRCLFSITPAHDYLTRIASQAPGAGNAE